MSECTCSQNLRIYEPNILVGKNQRWICSKCLKIGIRLKENGESFFYQYLDLAQDICEHNNVEIDGTSSHCRICEKYFT